MSGPEGFERKDRPNGDIAIFHHGKLAKMVKGADAKKLTTALGKKDADEQELLSEAAGANNAARPGTGPQGPKGLGGDGVAHGHGEFRRKSG